MVDLYFLDPGKRKREYNCAECPKKKQERLRCAESGFSNITRKRDVDRYGKADSNSTPQSFCPAKATWQEYAWAAELFEKCRVAVDSGFLPSEGALDDQDELFCEVFPVFLYKWKSRQYNRVWSDVTDFTGQVLKVVSKWLGGKK